MRRLFLVFLVLLLTASLVSAQGRTIRVGTESTYPPYEFRDDSGALVGFDVDLVQALAERLNWEVHWVEMPFDALIPTLERGEIDLVAACLSCTPDRARRVAFSDPYEITPSTFVVASGDYFPTGPDALRGKRIAVQPGTAEDRYVLDLKHPRRITFDRLDEAFLTLASGQVDAVFVDRPVAESYAGKGPYEGAFRLAFSLKLVGAEKAFATSLAGGGLIDDINDALRRLDDEGVLAGLRRKWL